MKKLGILSMLSVAIVAAGIMLMQSTSVNAEDLTLEITAAGGTGCVGAADLDAGSDESSYTAIALTGTFAGSFICTGSSNTVSSYTINATAKPTDGTTTATDVLGFVGYYQTQQGDSNCQDTITMSSSYTSIDSSAQNLLLRNSGGYPCTLEATGVKLEVQMPANATVGLYTGTLSFDDAGW